jgi:hypothetical protein
VSFQLTGPKSDGHADSLDEAKTALQAEHKMRQGCAV